MLAAVVSAWFSRTHNVKTLRDDVEELLDSVDKIGRVTRREQMRRVRAASKNVARSAEDDGSPPPELQEQPELSLRAPFDKAALRRQLINRRFHQ